MIAPTQTTEVIDENATKLLINADVALFIQNVMYILRKKGTLSDDINFNGTHIRGVVYNDSVITIYSDRTRRNVLVYRNRTGTIIVGIANGIVNLYHWELAFVDDHVSKMVSELKKIDENS